ncbi:MAG: cyclic nucleotide-binding domain-containing protein [Dehalococcoidales bacterium]|nr:cyclic nucleotide-binding domain-containing protein [Dehalococcoidales bacterium]
MVNASDLKGYNLFSGLEESALARIAELCTRHTYPANTVIFDPNTSADDVYLLEGGNDVVQIEIPIQEHDIKVTIHTLHKGEVFGWAALGPPHSRTATARCLEQASVIVIKGKDLLDLLENDAATGYQVMKNLSGIISSRLAYTTIVFRREIQRLTRKHTSMVTA